MDISVLSPTAVVYSGQAEQITVPLHGGIQGILENFPPLVGILMDGIVTVKPQNLRFSVHKGAILVMDNRVTVLAEEIRSIPA